MVKYLVLLEALKDGDLDESEVLAVCDTEEEANRVAQSKFEVLDDDYLENHDIAVGEVKEEDLEDSDDWESFKVIEVIHEKVESRRIFKYNSSYTVRICFDSVSNYNSSIVRQAVISIFKCGFNRIDIKASLLAFRIRINLVKNR